MAAIPFGAFSLDHPLGRGGMGVVWQGVHRRQDVPVAVKVISVPDESQRDDLCAAFRTEVRAVAGLQHPNVVVVLDHGEVPPEAAAESGGRLAERAPWLAMELVAGGTLAKVRHGLDWPAVRDILLGVLDGLAHAHARGVVHRDLKPANLLLTAAAGSPGFGPHAVKLTDFGLAHLVDLSTGPTLTRSGTPSYMAPEQFRGRWRDFGPWTDLYAVGVLGWRLLTASLPWPGRSWEDAARAHIKEALPAFVPTVAAPAGVEAWLRALLEKRPPDRIQRAADARRALLALDGPDAAPRLPATWRTESRAPPVRLLGAGLGLYGLRPVPLVDRHDERDRLWEALRAVASGLRPRAVVLRGPWGTGKSRLAAWLGERAHEAGAATVLRAVHEEAPAPGTGLEAMLARHLHTVGLARAEVHERLRKILSRWGLEADTAGATELLCPATEEERAAGAPTVRFGSAFERHVLIRRLLEAIAVERPLVLWLDDLQWAVDALTFAVGLLSSRRPLPVLVVATWRDDAAARRPAEEGLLALLAARADVEVVPVAALAEADGQELLRSVGLERPLADRLAERTAGNPLFTVQLVGAWVQAGLLEPGAEGFRLRPGAGRDLPDDLHRIWVRRLDLAVAGRGEAEVRGLELAAVLGQHVDRAEWRAACERASVAADDGLVDRLLGQRLLTADPHGTTFSFVHGMLRESLVRRATEGGRVVGLNSAAADALAGRRGSGIAERRAVHLTAARRFEEAVGPYKDAAVERTRDGQWDACLRLLDARDHALEAAGIRDEDERWGLGASLRATVAFIRGRPDDANHTAEALAARAAALGWRQVLAEALFTCAATARVLGRHDEALARIEAAAAAADRAGDAALAARCVGQRGWQLFSVGRADLAEPAFAACALRYGELRMPSMHAIASVGLGFALTALGRHDEADAVFRRAISACDASGTRLGAVDGWSGWAQLALVQGRLDAAEARFAEAARRADAIETPGLADRARCSVGGVLVRQGRWPAAEQVLGEVLASCRERGDRGGADRALAWLGACAASSGDAASAGARIDEALATIGENMDAELREEVREIARWLASAGRPDLAERLASCEPKRD